DTCRVIAEGFASADVRPGPIAMVERDFPVFVFAPPGKLFPFLKDLAEILRTLRADTLTISSEKSILRLARCAIEIPGRIPELYSPIPYIIPRQIFTAKLT